MSTLTLLAALSLLLILILSNVPVGFALAAAGTLGLLLLHGPDNVAASLGAIPYSSVASYSYILIPMFILMGLLVLHARIAQDAYYVASYILRWLPGGLGLATVAACAGFAAVTGSSAATVATMGRVSIGEMRRNGYSAGFAAGIVASAGTLGVLIPPSLVLVVYGILTGESVGALLIAGIIPGLLSAAVFGAVVLLRVRSQVSAVVGGSGAPDDPEFERPTPGRATASILMMLGVALLIILGAFSGWFTVTESGAMAASLALIFLLYRLFTDSLALG